MGIRLSCKMMGILNFPESNSSQLLSVWKDSLHWRLRRELCSGVYTVNSCSSCDHKMMVSDNRSWLRFKVKNNSLLTFSPLGLWSKKVWDLIWEGSQSIVGTRGVRWAQWPTGSQPSIWLSHFLCSQCASRQKHHYCSWTVHQWILAVVKQHMINWTVYGLWWRELNVSMTSEPASVVSCHLDWKSYTASSPALALINLWLY